MTKIDLLFKQFDLEKLNKEINDYMAINLKDEVTLYMNTETIQDLELALALPLYPKPYFEKGVIVAYNGHTIYVDNKLRYAEVEIK